MNKRILLCLAAAVAATCFSGLGSFAAQNGGDVKPTKDLYYFVIDRSGSVEKSNLVTPIRGAIVDFVGRLSADTSVEIVFFDSTASSPKRWDKMDLASKGDFSAYFYEQFKPKNWTRLYDTVAEVILRAQKEAPNYRSVNIVILSDGIDEGPNGKLGSKKHLSWASVESLATDLKISNRDSLITWMYLGPKPPANSSPQPGGPIDQISVTEPQKGIVIKAPAPKAEFTSSPAKVQVNEPVLFVLESELGVAEAQWFFGDGSTSSDLKSRHAYATEGSYTVKVSVSGAGGENTAERPNAVQVLRNVALEASFKWSPQTVRIRQKIQFVDESLGSPDSWTWDFTGRPSLSDRSPTVAFATAGPVTVTLTIGKDGRKHSVTQRLEVQAPAPINAAFKWSPEAVHVGEKVQFVDASIGSPDSWSWEFTGLAAMQERSPIVEFNTAGPVTTTLTIQKEGQKNSTSMKLEVLPLAPLKASFKRSPEKARVGETIQFVDESLGAPDSWAWEVTGQPPSSDKSPAVAFTKAGPVTVTLTVAKDKRTNIDTQTFDVLPPPPPSLKAAFSVTPDKGSFPLNVQFKDASQGAIASYRWDFGDEEGSDVKNPRHTYQEAGSWTPRLTIRNAENQEARDAGEVVIAVSAPPPPPPWWMRPLIYACVGLAAWVLLIVPFVFRPILAPQAKVAFRGPTVYFIRNLAGRGLSNLIWPRSSVSIGSGKAVDIKIGSAGQKAARFARVARVPLSSSYMMTVLQTDSVSKMVTQNTGLIAAREVSEQVPSGRRVALRQGDSFIFSGNVRLMWEQPSLKKQQKKK